MAHGSRSPARRLSARQSMIRVNNDGTNIEFVPGWRSFSLYMIFTLTQVPSRTSRSRGVSDWVLIQGDETLDSWQQCR